MVIGRKINNRIEQVQYYEEKLPFLKMRIRFIFRLGPVHCVNVHFFGTNFCAHEFHFVWVVFEFEINQRCQSSPRLLCLWSSWCYADS
ncbi:Membrane-bound O-acyltransferase GUP1 [Trichinella spiralis]|uniref:Membrane-bound O-acyltransferase GUP1 n=1 Tax=Trichinella spiralis TaxID=6334 RepID=A0ABR3KJ66_TRISP